jgi:hypothetical protein
MRLSASGDMNWGCTVMTKTFPVAWSDFDNFENQIRSRRRGDVLVLGFLAIAVFLPLCVPVIALVA